MCVGGGGGKQLYLTHSHTIDINTNDTSNLLSRLVESGNMVIFIVRDTAAWKTIVVVFLDVENSNLARAFGYDESYGTSIVVFEVEALATQYDGHGFRAGCRD